jgi:SAM-dependent methyltransferase
MSSAYDSSEQVGIYRAASGLRPAEQTIVRRLHPFLAGSRVLDLGVGGGRTTSALAALAAEYVGLDHAANMVRACQERFGSGHPNARFVQGDASRLRETFPASSFDFVLFSFNGIDHLDHEARVETFRQVHEVLRPGGLFCFSSHNVERSDLNRRWPPLTWTSHPLKLALRCWRFARTVLAWRYQNRRTDFARLRREGRGMLREQIIAPGRGPFASMYYASRQECTRQLGEAGFVDVEVFSDRTGLAAGGQVDGERWLYYLCARP